MQHSDNSALRQELLDYTTGLFHEFVEALPENNYWAFGGYSVIAPEILSYLTRYSLPETDNLSASWNYLDAACQGLTALRQLFDKKTHRPLVTKSKGIVNLASSIQTLVLTALSTGTLGPIGFAAATGTSFLLSLDEGVRQLRRLYSPEYFCVDNLAELDKIEELIQEKTASLQALRALPAQNRFSQSGKLAIKLAYSTQQSLLAKREELRRSIEVQLDRDYARYPAGSPLQTLIQRYNRRQIKHRACDDFLQRLQEREPPANHQKAEAAGKKLDHKTRQAFFYATADSLIWGIAFTGSVLTCIPGMQGFAFACIAIAVALFLLKSSAKLATKSEQTNRFFKTATPPPGSEGLELRPIVVSTEEKEPWQAAQKIKKRRGPLV